MFYIFLKPLRHTCFIIKEVKKYNGFFSPTIVSSRPGVRRLWGWRRLCKQGHSLRGPLFGRTQSNLSRYRKLLQTTWKIRQIQFKIH